MQDEDTRDQVDRWNVQIADLRFKIRAKKNPSGLWPPPLGRGGALDGRRTVSQIKAVV